MYYKHIKDGITVSVVLDRRTLNKDGKYPVKIKVYHLDFETDGTEVDDSAADDTWLQNVEARFESVVTPILAKYEAPGYI